MAADFPMETSIAICDGFNLLVPRNLIADVVSAATIDTTRDTKTANTTDGQLDTPSGNSVTIGEAWSKGMLNWRGLNLPVISIEQILLNRSPRLRGSHVAIFHGTKDTEKLAFYGVPLQAMPHNFKVTAEADLVQRSDDTQLKYCALKVTARGVAAIIPELEAIEDLLLSGES